MWICLILFESKFHNNIMKQALWYYVIFIYQETTTWHIFSKCLFFFLPLPLCLVLSGFFLAWVPGLRTHYIYPTKLPYHFSNWPTPIPDVKFQTLLCALSNQGFNHKNQFESPKNAERFISFFHLLQWVLCVNCELGKHKKKKLKRNM